MRNLFDSNFLIFEELHPVIAIKESYIIIETSNYYCHSEYKLFLDFLYEGEQNGKKEGG